jgi:hypothetical protein
MFGESCSSDWSFLSRASDKKFSKHETDFLVGLVALYSNIFVLGQKLWQGKMQRKDMSGEQ